MTTATTCRHDRTQEGERAAPTTGSPLPTARGRRTTPQAMPWTRRPTPATPLSLPRDCMTLAPPSCSATAPRSEWHMRLWNQNYSIGGPGCLICTLEGNTGVFIDHYAVVDFRGFKQMVDALGGVKVCTP